MAATHDPLPFSEAADGYTFPGAQQRRGEDVRAGEALAVPLPNQSDTYRHRSGWQLPAAACLADSLEMKPEARQ